MDTRWLITGGCGFIGRNLVKNLLEEGKHSIRIVDNLSGGSKDDLAKVCDFDESHPDNLNTGFSKSVVEFIEGDILDKELAVRVTEKIDVIVHLAANTGVGPSVENPVLDCETNVLGTLNYLEAARMSNVGKFVFASSGAPAGEVDPPIHEELAPHPVSPYGASKLAGEGYCSAYFKTFGVETVVLRFGNVYGPLSTHKDSVVAKFIKKTLMGEALEIYGDGNQTRDFIFIDDLIMAIRKAKSCNNIGGEIFQIANNHETTVKELTERIIKYFSKYDEKRSVKVVFTEERLGDVKRNFSDTSKAKKILKWSPKFGLDEGIEKTILWFRQSVG